MGFDEIQARIIADGENEIKRINDEAQKEINRIKEDIQKKVDARVGKIHRDSEREMEMIRKRTISEANTKVMGRKGLERNRIIDKVFEDAADAVLELDDEEKKKILENLAKEGRMGIKDPLIMVDKKYKKLIKDAKPHNIGDFGVVIRSKDGKVRIDNTLRSRLERLKVILKPRIASVLFAENGTDLSDR